jgi:hypothetical protein
MTELKDLCTAAKKLELVSLLAYFQNAKYFTDWNHRVHRNGANIVDLVLVSEYEIHTEPQ